MDDSGIGDEPSLVDPCRRCSKVHFQRFLNTNVHILKLGDSTYTCLRDFLDILKKLLVWDKKMSNYNYEKYKKLTEGNDQFSMHATKGCTGKSFTLMSARALSYIVDDIILHKKCSKPIELLMTRIVADITRSTSHEEKNNMEPSERIEIDLILLGLKSLKSCKTLNNVQPSDPDHNSYETKLQVFETDCDRLKLATDSDKCRYAMTLRKIYDLAPDLRDILNRYMDNEGDVGDGDITDALLGYSKLPWAIKALLELMTKDKTRCRNRAKEHHERKYRRMYFIATLLCRVRNSHYVSALQRKIGDVLYTKHSDLSFIYNMCCHLGICQSLTTVRQRQLACSSERDVKAVIQQKHPRTAVFIYDNFCKFHAVIDPVFDDPQTVTVDILNRGVLLLPEVEKCSLCLGSCTCRWSNESTKEAVDFDSILLNASETVLLKNLRSIKCYNAATELVDAKKEVSIFNLLSSFHYPCRFP